MSATKRPSAPILSIVGNSNSGKTTLIEKLLSDLSGRGWRIATIKHDVHSFDVDHPGKDSWRHREAGAAAVVVSAPSLLFLTVKVEQETPLKRIRDLYLSDYDLVLTEGYRQADAPKIEVHRSGCSSNLICIPGVDNLVAVVSDCRWDIEAPVFHLDDVRAVADFIEERYLAPVRSGV